MLLFKYARTIAPIQYCFRRCCYYGGLSSCPIFSFSFSFSNTSPPFHYLCENIRVCMLLYGYCPYDEDALFYGMVVDSKHVFYFFLISNNTSNIPFMDSVLFELFTRDTAHTRRIPSFLPLVPLPLPFSSLSFLPFPNVGWSFSSTQPARKPDWISSPVV